MIVFNNIKILSYIVLTMPLIIDTINGMSRGSVGKEDGYIGIIFKGIVILYSIIWSNALSRTYIWLLLLVGLICFVMQYLLGVFELTTIMSFVKILYAFFVLAIFTNKSCRRYEPLVINAAVLYGTGASIILISSYFFGWGYSSYYSGSSFGVKGFFIAMNDICLTILLMNCLSLFYYQKKKKICYLIYSLLMCVGNVLTGSMAAIFGTLTVIMTFCLSIYIVPFKKYKSKAGIKIIMGGVLLLIMLYAITWISKSIDSDAYLSQKYSDLYSTFTEVSGRKSLINASNNILRERSFIYDMFGQGTGFTKGISKQLGMPMNDGGKSAEVDYLDLFGTYGLFITVLLFYYPIKLAIMSIIFFFRKRKIDYYWIAIASIIFLGHSIYGGHALSSPMSYSYFIVFVYLGLNRKLVEFTK